MRKSDVQNIMWVNMFISKDFHLSARDRRRKALKYTEDSEVQGIQFWIIMNISPE